MNRIWLSLSNAPIFFLIGLLGISVQTALFFYYPVYLLQPDLLLLFVIWCALRREILEGGILTLLFAHLSEIHSAGTRGLFFVTYMAIFLLIRALHRWILFPDRKSYLKLTAGIDIFWKILVLAFLFGIGKGKSQIEHFVIFLIPGVLVQVGIANLVFPLLDRFDRITFKDPKVRQALEDELLLDEEGL